MSITKDSSLHAWHEHRLANEGAAQLEGGFYGSEVLQAANAAVSCGADIIAADRSKPLSRARLQAAITQKLDEELSRLEGGAGAKLDNRQRHMSVLPTCGPLDRLSPRATKLLAT